MIAAVSLVKIGVFRKMNPLASLLKVRRENQSIVKVVSLKRIPSWTGWIKGQRNCGIRAAPGRRSGFWNPFTKGNIYPPAMITLANLYRTQDRLEEAQDLLEMLDDFIPGQPAILFNLAGLWIQQDDYEVALDYLEQLAGMELEDTLSARVSELRRWPR